MNKHVMFPPAEYDDEHEIKMERITSKLEEQVYNHVVERYWPEFKDVPFCLVGHVFGIPTKEITYKKVCEKLEEVRKRLVRESFANEM